MISPFGNPTWIGGASFLPLVCGVSRCKYCMDDPVSDIAMYTFGEGRLIIFHVILPRLIFSLLICFSTDSPRFQVCPSLQLFLPRLLP